MSLQVQIRLLKIPPQFDLILCPLSEVKYHRYFTFKCLQQSLNVDSISLHLLIVGNCGNVWVNEVTLHNKACHKTLSHIYYRCPFKILFQALSVSHKHISLAHQKRLTRVFKVIWSAPSCRTESSHNLKYNSATRIITGKMSAISPIAILMSLSYLHVFCHHSVMKVYSCCACGGIELPTLQ